MIKNKIFKKLILIVGLLCLLGIIFIIQNSNNTKESKEDKSVSNNTDNTTTSDATVYTDDLPTWTQCEVTAGENSIELPITYKDFSEKTNFRFLEKYEDGNFQALDYEEGILLTNDNNELIIIKLENTSSEAQSLKDCLITSVTVLSDLSQFLQSSKMENVNLQIANSIKFPESITLGMNIEEVHEKLGDSFDSISNLDGTYISEYWSINNVYTFSISFENEKCVSMTISIDET